MRLVERECELCTVGELVGSLHTGKGSLLIVDGPVASGKTEILQAVASLATESGALNLTATASPSEQDRPLGVIIQLLQHISPDENDQLFEIMSRLKRVQNLSDDREIPTMDLLVDVYELLADFAQKSPVSIVVDDLHHSDGASLSVILGLVRRAQRKPILFALGQQSSCMRGRQLFQTELRRDPGCCYMWLKPLTFPGVGQFLAQHLDEERAARLAPVYDELSGGNPLLLRALLDDYQIAATRQEGGGSQGAARLVPSDAYRQAVTACLQRGSREAVEVAHALTVLQASGSEHLTGRLLDIGPDAIVRLKHVLIGDGLLGKTGFRHPVARDAVSEHMPSGRRTALNLRAARLLFDDGSPATAVATHLLAAGQARKPWAPAILGEAAEQVLREDRAALAKSYLELALSETGDPAEQAAVTLQLARSVWRYSPDTALRRTLSMVNTLDVRQAPEDQSLQLIKSLLRHGRLTGAEAVLARLGDRIAVPAHQSSDDLTAFRLWLSCSYPGLARRFLFGERRGATGEPYKAAGTTTALLQATTLLYEVLYGNPGQHEIAGTQEELRVLRLSDATLEPFGTALMALLYAGWTDAAQQWCSALLREATQRGVSAWIGVLSSIMAEVVLRRGDLQATEEYARAALSHWGGGGGGGGGGSPRATLLTAVTACGDLHTAGELINEPLPDSIFGTRDGLHYQQARGQFQLALGHPDAALRDFRGCGERMKDWGLDRPGLLAWRTDAAQALLRLDLPEEARELALEQLRLVGPANRRVRGTTLRVLAATLPVEQRLDPLARAVDDLEIASDRLELAQALADLSRARTGVADRTGARHAMLRARQLARSCKADALLYTLYEDQQDEQDEQPQRPPTPQLLEREGEAPELSTAERRVARLVATGRSNREVARLLFVTVSTIEQHLTNIYRKLTISRRTELYSLYKERT